MRSGISRREFLKLTGTGAAVLTAAPLSRALAVPAFVQAAAPLTIGINAWVTSLDAQTQLGPSNIGYRIYGMIHDSLLHVGRNGQPEGLLATRWANDGLEWRFQLREGVVFHDGSAMTADDVVFSLNRILDPQFEGIGISLRPFISSVEAIGEYEVSLTTTAVDPLLPYRLANYWVNIMPRAGVEAATSESLQSKPIGAGPYKVVEFGLDRLVLERHSEYWGGVPAASEVILRLIPEDAIRVGALQSGEVDLITNVPVDQLDILDAAANLKVASAPLFNFISALFNTSSGPTANVDVRRALALAIDRELIANELFGGRNRPMTDYLLPGTLGFDESRGVLPYDPEEAVAALEAAGYAGEAISFTPPASYYVNSDLVTQVINEMWRAIGVTTDYAPAELGAYGQAYFTGQVTSTIQSFDSYGDPQATFFNVWSTSAATFFRRVYYPPTAEFDQIMERLNTVVDPEARIPDIRALVGLLEQDVPLTPIYQTSDYFALRSDIAWQPHPLFYIDLRPGNFSL